MTENEKQSGDKQSGLTQNIMDRLIKIKAYADTIIPIVGKKDMSAMEVSQAFDLADEIQVESEEIIQALFDLKDIVPPPAQTDSK